MAKPRACRKIMYGNTDAATMSRFERGKLLLQCAAGCGTGKSRNGGNRRNGKQCAGNRPPT